MDRRGFLKRLLGGSAAVALAPLVPRPPEPVLPPPIPPGIILVAPPDGIPAGWTRVRDLDARYARPAAASGHTHSGPIAVAHTGWSANHTHSAPHPHLHQFEFVPYAVVERE